jgi:hypothetical protein
VRSLELEPEGTGHVKEVKRKRQFCEADSSGFGLTVNRVSNRVGGEVDTGGLLLNLVKLIIIHCYIQTMTVMLLLKITTLFFAITYEPLVY